MSEQNIGFAGKLAVIVGGSKGIGKAVSIKLATAGAEVVVVSRDAESGNAVCDEIRHTGGKARWLRGDYLNSDEMQHVADTISGEGGSCDILVASGGPGYPRPKPFLETPIEDFSAFFSSRCIGRLYAVRAFAEQMRSKGYGKIVLLTTDAGRVPTPSEVLNGSAAAALVFATRSLALELTRYGLRVNAVSTTVTTGTPSYERYRAKVDAGQVDKIANVFSAIERKTPLGRLNTPEEVAEAVLFLCSEASDRISGAVLSVNGGLSVP